MNLRQKGVAVERLSSRLSSQHFAHGNAAPQDIRTLQLGELAELPAFLQCPLTENAKLPTADGAEEAGEGDAAAHPD
jgi:hypothetical protein